MIWSDVSPLDDGLRAVVSWNVGSRLARYIGRIECVGHGPAMLYPEPHGHEPPGTPPAPSFAPPAGARVHVIGFPGDRVRGLLGGLLG